MSNVLIECNAGMPHQNPRRSRGDWTMALRSTRNFERSTEFQVVQLIYFRECS